MTSAHETITNIGATGAITSPWWLPGLYQVSQVAALMLPILGVIWLLTQISVKIYVTYKKQKADDQRRTHERAGAGHAQGTSAEDQGR